MKPKVLHCVDDPNMGGVNFALQSLCSSPLQNDVDFTIQYIDFSQGVTLDEVPDIVCLHGASNWRSLFHILRFKLKYPKVKLVLQEHHYSAAFVDEQIRSPRRFYLMLKLSYSLMDSVIAIAPSQQQWMLKHQLTTANKIALLGQGRDLTEFIATHSSTQQKSENAVPVIAAYGRFHHQKGFDLLINAMKLVKQPCRLRLAGEGEQAAKLKALAAEHLNMGSSNIEFVGKVDDVPSFLQACDAVIIPSRWEPFGLTFIESLAMNKPIIASQVDGLGDQVSQHIPDYQTFNVHHPAISPIAKPLSVEAIADAINQFLAQSAASDVSDKEPSSDSITGYIEHWKAQQWLDLQQAWKGMFDELLGNKQGR